MVEDIFFFFFWGEVFYLGPPPEGGFPPAWFFFLAWGGKADTKTRVRPGSQVAASGGRPRLSIRSRYHPTGIGHRSNSATRTPGCRRTVWIMKADPTRAPHDLHV